MREERLIIQEIPFAWHFNEKTPTFVDPIEMCEIIKVESRTGERKLKEEIEILKQKTLDKEKLMNIKLILKMSFFTT